MWHGLHDSLYDRGICKIMVFASWACLSTPEAPKIDLCNENPIFLNGIEQPGNILLFTLALLQHYMSSTQTYTSPIATPSLHHRPLPSFLVLLVSSRVRRGDATEYHGCHKSFRGTVGRPQFALRLMARPRGGGGQEGIMESRSGLMARIGERCGLGRRETVEAQSWEEFRSLRGIKEDALRKAREWQDRTCTVWTDGSRLESEGVGAAVAFWEEGRWTRRGTYLGKNKEVYDAEVFAILRAVRLPNERNESRQDSTIFSNSQEAISTVQHDRCGPAQALAKAAIATTDDPCGRDNTLTIRWTPSHEGVEGNEQAGEAARLAEGGRGRAEPEYLREASLSHLMRKTTEARTQATSVWVRDHVGRRHRYRPPPGAGSAGGWSE